MIWSRQRKLWPTAVSVLALLIGSSPALGSQRSPGQKPVPGSVEAGMWAELDRVEADTKASGELDKSPELNDFVRSVICKAATSYCPELRLYVLDRPFFNATMAPNGATEVWSGLLLFVQDESELAFVLGHEFSHFRNNDSLDAFETVKRNANAALAVNIGIALLAAGAAANTTSPNAANNISDSANMLMNLTSLAAAAAYFSFSRDQESQADIAGMDAAIASGYDPSAGQRMWTALVAMTQASDFEKVRKSDTRGSIFRTHPLTAERIAALKAKSDLLPSGAAPDTRSQYRAIIRPHLSRWIRDQLRLKDFGQTLFLLDRLSGLGEDMGLIDYFRGETYRIRRKDGDLIKARDAYLKASLQPDVPVGVWRELGDLYVKESQVELARKAYQTYLAKAPSADDAWLVQDSLSSLTNPASTASAPSVPSVATPTPLAPPTTAQSETKK